MEYDGLKLMRVDEKYDTSGGSIDAGDPWRTVEAATYGPGVVGNLLPKRVYTHTNNDATPDATNDFYYAYDHVGNVRVVFDADGEEAYHFNQDAFGNELAFENYTGDSWATARAAGVTEHQTGKWIDPFTGLYFFQARWYDSGAGRFVGRSTLPRFKEAEYLFCENNPLRFVDFNGQLPFRVSSSLMDTIRSIIDAACAAAAAVPGWIEGVPYDGGGENPGSGNKWPRTHCMWNCYMQKWCRPGVAGKASLLKEIFDLYKCLKTGDRGYCYSAFQIGDFRDNKAGRDAAKSGACCIKGCTDQGVPPGTRERLPGPFWWIVNNVCCGPQ